LNLTQYLAIYAAILSTAVFFWNVVRFRARSKVRVRVVFGMEKVGGEYVHGAMISVQNPSAHAVHISNISLVYHWRRTTFLDSLEHIFRFRRFPRRIGWCHSSLSNYDIDDKCPVKLEPGMSHQVLVPEEAIEKMLSDAKSRRFIAVVQDALWRDKYSSVIDYPVVEKKQLADETVEQS